MVAPSSTLINLVELDLRSSPFRAHSGVGTIHWDGKEWIGAGVLGKLSRVSESLELQPARVRLSLSGLPPELARVALAEHYQGRRARIWLALLDTPGSVLVPTPIFSGRIDVMHGVLDKHSEISVQLESRLADSQRARVRRYTSVDQRGEFPADRGLDYVAEAAEYEVLWGQTQR